MNLKHRTRKIVNQIITPQRVRFVAITVIVIAVILLIFSFISAHNRKTVFGPQLGADFASFYLASQILNSPEPERLYDIPLQNQLYHELLPEVSEGKTLPFPYAPFLAILVKPLTLVSYEVAFGAWLVINLVCYILGFLLLWRSNPDLTEHSVLTPLFVAVSFAPFLLEGLIGGQSVGLIILFLGLSFYLQVKGQHWAGGVILSLCLFKPTLLVLVVPMLLVSGKLKAFVGFLIGSVALVGVSWLAVGLEGLHGYVNLLLTYASTRASTPGAFRLEKYVDLTSFAQLLSLPKGVVTVGVGIVSLTIFILLVRAWWGYLGQDSHCNRAAWASALVWTPILAPQCAIYDSALAVAAFVLIASVHSLAVPTRDTESESEFAMWATLTYCSAFLTGIVAVLLSVQLLTVVLFGAGLWMLRVTNACRTQG
ncbi:MAG: DUF2029 domain-containing protein [Anaerolineaceae bacterium]|nr:DUF2029 domain-containing protein [Anaerolineaceae bacterium]